MHRPAYIFAASCVAGGLAASASALEPAEIAVLFNTSSPSSLAVARHYLNARQIPANHLIPVTCDAAENITEAQYRTSFVPQVLKQLADRKLDAPGEGGITCIVTTFDIPLRILAHQPTPAEHEEIAGLEKQLIETAAELETQVAAYDQVALASSTSQPSSPPPPAAVPATAPGQPGWQPIIQRLNTAATAAAARIAPLAPPARSQATAQFIRVQQHVAGITGLLSSLRIPADAAGAEAAQRGQADMTAQLRELQQQYAALVKQQDSARIRKEMIAVRLKAEGLVGQARAIDDVIAYLQPPETESCLDNELTLLFADQKYPRGKWLINPRNIEVYPDLQRMARNPGGVPRTLLVTRIDGSTVQRTEQMIDTTLKVEAAGLEGKLYLDARGMHGSDGYALFDADIRKAADWLKQHAAIDTILDDNEALLQAKDAPDCALYCGWYALRSYHDSAQWVPGAVGYHVASNEMFSLHNPGETAWVPNLLNHGFCGTLGPTDEPYLSSFPKPSLFFPLLLSGQFTQGEVWQLTDPFLSWRNGYVGDPLYNPFKVHPRVKTPDLLDHVILRNAYPALGRQPPSTGK